METASLANSWVDSYLEALLSSGLSTEYTKKATYDEPETPKAGTLAALASAEKNIAAKYYVNQILNLDEEACTMAWQKVSRNQRLVGEKDARLQYLSWRVWGMRRKHNLLKEANAAEISELREKEEAAAPDQQLASAGVGGVNDAEELSKLFPGARLKSLVIPESDASGTEPDLLSPDAPSSPLHAPAVTPGGNLADEIDANLSEQRVPKLYCVLISMHGLVRGQRMELGKDPDTGGQVKYVVELAAALSKHPAVHRVDLLTRMIRDPKVDESYGRPEEAITEKEGNMGGAYIVRIPCGPVDQYLRKEHLWPYVREFADNALSHVQSTMTKLMQSGEACELYYVHGHYADAGEAAALMSYTLGCDMVLTGHSLGRNKLDHLLKSGTISRAEIEATYAIGRRIEGEERALDAAMMVFTSTQQEVKDQWGLYDGYDAALERVVRQRYRRGRHFPIMNVIPPGLDFSNLKVAQPVDPWEAATKAMKSPRVSSASNLAAGDDTAASGDQESGTPKAAGSPRANGSPRVGGTPRAFTEDPPIWREVFRFLRNPRKPVILAMSRPDAKKNVTTLVKAYGSNAALREIANLVLILGNREVIDSMAPGSQKVMNEVLKLIDAYNLYGLVAYPKKHTQKDISDIYLLPAATRGVFVNIALQEPFGLTLIEAAAHGVPIVATTHGGPVDIVHTLHNGILVEPTDVRGVADALLSILTSNVTWDEYATNGVANINAYAWPSHCVKALRSIEAEKQGQAKRRRNVIRSTFSSSLDDLLLGAPAVPGGGDEGPTPRASSHDDLDLLSELRSPSESAYRSPSESAFSPSAAERIELESASRSQSLVDPGHLDRMEQRARANPASASKAGAGAAAVPRLTQPREKYLVFLVDSKDSVARLGGLLALKKGKALLGLSGSGVGVGVASTATLTETKDMLGAAGLSLKDLDFVIANAGSEIWYCSNGAEPQLDEAYEAHIDDRWDKLSVRRVLAQVLSQKAVLLGSSGAPATQLQGQRPRIAVDTEAGAHHLMVALSGSGGAEEQSALMSRVRSRLRRGGLRTQMVVHADGAASKLHVTPSRASRALALRFLARRHKVDLSDLVLVCCATASEGEGKVARFGTSDMEDVVAGVQGVLLVPPAKEGADEGFPVEVGLYQHDGRLQWLPASATK